jgi:hypothetical protein
MITVLITDSLSGEERNLEWTEVMSPAAAVRGLEDAQLVVVSGQVARAAPKGPWEQAVVAEGSGGISQTKGRQPGKQEEQSM